MYIRYLQCKLNGQNRAVFVFHRGLGQVTDVLPGYDARITGEGRGGNRDLVN